MQAGVGDPGEGAAQEGQASAGTAAVSGACAPWRPCPSGPQGLCVVWGCPWVILRWSLSSEPFGQKGQQPLLV